MKLDPLTIFIIAWLSTLALWFAAHVVAFVLHRRAMRRLRRGVRYLDLTQWRGSSDRRPSGPPLRPGDVTRKATFDTAPPLRLTGEDFRP